MSLRAGSMVLVRRNDGEEDAPTPALLTREVPGTGVHGEGVNVNEGENFNKIGSEQTDMKEFPLPKKNWAQAYKGGLKGGRNNDNSFDTYIPIEQLKPNDCVISIDGQPHLIIDIFKIPYQGGMVGIQHKASPHTLWMTPDQEVLCLQQPRIPDGKNDWSADPKINAKWRKALRNNQTPAEQILWSLLRKKQLGVKFRRQHSIGPYIADFYSREAGLVIECDGPGHYKDDARNYDFRREQYMNERGLCVLHFNNDDIFNNMDTVYEVIMNSIRFDMTDLEIAKPVRADELRKVDKVFSAKEMKAVVLDSIRYKPIDEIVYDLEIDGSLSFLTEVCLVHG